MAEKIKFYWWKLFMTLAGIFLMPMRLFAGGCAGIVQCGCAQSIPFGGQKGIQYTNCGTNGLQEWTYRDYTCIECCSSPSTNNCEINGQQCTLTDWFLEGSCKECPTGSTRNSSNGTCTCPVFNTANGNNPTASPNPYTVPAVAPGGAKCTVPSTQNFNQPEGTWNFPSGCQWS